MEVKEEPKLSSASEHNKRNRSRRRRGSEHSSHAHAPALESFRGEHEDLRGWVYTYDTSARAYQYTKTTEAITKWVKRNLKWSSDITSAINKLTAPNPEEWSPKSRKPKEGEDQALVDKILNEEIKLFMLRKQAYIDNKCNVFTVVLGQCDEPLKAKLEGQEDWEDIFSQDNLVELMKSIKKWLINQQGSKSPMTTMAVALETLIRVKQGRFESLTEYRRKFVAASDVLKHIGVEVNFPDMVKQRLKKSKDNSEEEVKKAKENMQKKINQLKEFLAQFGYKSP